MRKKLAQFKLAVAIAPKIKSPLTVKFADGEALKVPVPFTVKLLTVLDPITLRTFVPGVVMITLSVAEGERFGVQLLALAQVELAEPFQVKSVA